MPNALQRLCLVGLLTGLSCSALLPAQAQSALEGPGSQPTTTSQQPEAVPASATTSQPRSAARFDSYIIGPGDSFQIELLEIPELSGTYSVGPDGVLYLPRLRALYVEGLTIEELRYFLVQQFKPYVRDPDVFIQPLAYRPLRIYVGGEVQRPGYYTLSTQQPLSQPPASDPAAPQAKISATRTADSESTSYQHPLSSSSIATVSNPWPTLFDAIQSAQGVTAFSDLSSIQVTRRQPLSNGGGRARATFSFLKLLSEGDETQNIRLFDGDVISIGKSSTILRDQILKASQTNLSPQFLEAFVSGRVKKPGAVTIPQGASLNQAIIAAGGVQLLRGKVEFVRFTRAGEVDRRIFGYNPGAPTGTQSNPILMTGDIINVRESVISATTGLLNELTGPFVGVYSVYSLFR